MRRPLFKELKILTIPSLYIYKLVLFVKQNTGEFTRNIDVYRFRLMTTRHGHDLRILVHHHSFYEKGPCYNAIKAYNALPQELKSINNIYSFKNQLKLYLLENTVIF